MRFEFALQRSGVFLLDGRFCRLNLQQTKHWRPVLISLAFNQMFQSSSFFLEAWLLLAQGRSSNAGPPQTPQLTLRIRKNGLVNDFAICINLHCFRFLVRSQSIESF